MFQAISLMKEPSKETGSLIHKCRVGNASTLDVIFAKS